MANKPIDIDEAGVAAARVAYPPARPYKKPKQVREESAARIKAVRERLGLSRGKFAALLSTIAIRQRIGIIVSEWTVHSWESGKRVPDLARLALIEEAERRADQIDREQAAREEVPAEVG